MRWKYLAVVAAIAALAIAGLLIARAPESNPLLAADIGAWQRSGTQRVIASTYAILRTRGAAVDAEIPLPPAGQVIELRLLPEFTARPHYRVRLFRMTADDSLQLVAEIGKVAADDDGFLTIFIDAARLQPGPYRLAVAGDIYTDAADKENAFMLRLRPAARGDPSAKSPEVA